MPRGRKVSPEQIVVMLRQMEVQLAQGNSLALACKEAGISEQSLALPWQVERNQSDSDCFFG